MEKNWCGFVCKTIFADFFPHFISKQFKVMLTIHPFYTRHQVSINLLIYLIWMPITKWQICVLMRKRPISIRTGIPMFCSEWIKFSFNSKHRKSQRWFHSDLKEIAFNTRRKTAQKLRPFVGNLFVSSWNKH